MTSQGTSDAQNMNYLNQSFSSLTFQPQENNSLTMNTYQNTNNQSFEQMGASVSYGNTVPNKVIPNTGYQVLSKPLSDMQTQKHLGASRVPGNVLPSTAPDSISAFSSSRNLPTMTPGNMSGRTMSGTAFARNVLSPSVPAVPGSMSQTYFQQASTTPTMMARNVSTTMPGNMPQTQFQQGAIMQGNVSGTMSQTQFQQGNMTGPVMPGNVSATMPQTQFQQGYIAGPVMPGNLSATVPPTQFQQGNMAGPVMPGNVSATMPQTQFQQGHMTSPMMPGNVSATMTGNMSQATQFQQSNEPNTDHLPNPIDTVCENNYYKSDTVIQSPENINKILASADNVTRDQSCAKQRFIRSTMYRVPVTVNMLKQVAVPFGLVISPFALGKRAESQLPIRNIEGVGPVRCRRCKAYMCPYMQFTDGGRSFYCVFCKSTTMVPTEYFQYLDYTGHRIDKSDCPELMLGAYEFVATKDYCRNSCEPQQPAFIFVMDVSYHNIRSGLINLLCSNMKDILKLMPKDVNCNKPTIQVGFITYDSTVHFYNIKHSLNEPKMLVVSDVQDMFAPLSEGLLADSVISEVVIDSLMEEIPKKFGSTQEAEGLLLSAIQAGLAVLKSANCQGKLFVFHSALPFGDGPGKLKNRENKSLLGTENEKSILTAQSKVYSDVAEECVNAGCSVDLFIFNNLYVDLPTIGDVAKYTGGEVFKYPFFRSDINCEQLLFDIKQNISRPIGFDAVMRVRTSLGIRPCNFYGHYFMSNVTDVQLANITSNKTIAVEVKHDCDIPEEDTVYIQVATLYTSCGGQRRIRILNLSLKTCSELSDVYCNFQLGATVNFLSKQAVTSVSTSNPKAIKESLIRCCVHMLACYRKNCVNSSLSKGQLLLPDRLKLFPLYVSCIIRSDALTGSSDTLIDDRWLNMHFVNISDISNSLSYFYPLLIPVHEIDVNSEELPVPIRCSGTRLRNDAAFILVNGVHMFLWIGLMISQEWIFNVFGVHSAAQIDTDKPDLVVFDNPVSRRTRLLIQQLRDQNNRSMKLTIVRERDPVEHVFKRFLVEDRYTNSSASYIEFVSFVHKEVLNIMS